MKRGNDENVCIATVDRCNLWHALTPQMFRLRELRDAISTALEAGVMVTDEAQAMEMTGVEPLLVVGHSDNIKITQPGDQQLAEWFLRVQEESQCG
jgi:2-C-methyl-D-erythritol 4-phosphate cytidylyltransferase